MNLVLYLKNPLQIFFRTLIQNRFLRNTCQDLWSDMEFCIFNSLKRCGALKSKSQKQRKVWMSSSILALIRKRNANPENRSKYQHEIQRLISRAKQQSWWRFQCSRGREVPLDTLGDSMESASAIQSSFREFSSP